MNSDTPETDIEERMAYSQEYMVPTEFARRLERERDEAREIAHRFRWLYYTQLGIQNSASWFPWEAKNE
jgi:hypothetical protein